jgi:DUF1680 family protein
LSVAEKNGWSAASLWRRTVADTVLRLQNAKGYFGPDLPLDQKDTRILSGNAFALRGLLDAFEDTGEDRYLHAARRMRGFFEKTFPYWHEASDGKVHEFWGHCLDGLVKLHRLDNDGKALDLARRIAGNVGRTRHTHHSLSMLRGMVDLYNVTQEPRHLTSVRDYLAWCREHRLVTGGVPEVMPGSKQDEGCALADYMVLNLMMFQATGEMEFLNDAEHVMVNHFFMNQFHTGGFGHRGYASQIMGGKSWQGWEGRFGSENPGCCSLWGQWALGRIGPYLITGKGDGFEINIYAQADVAFPDRSVRFTLDSDFPRCRRGEIRVYARGSRSFPLFLRVPPWAENVSLAVNDELVEAEIENNRMQIRRPWEFGDKVTLFFHGGIRTVPWRGGGIAVFDGPLCLALSSADSDVTSDWSLILSEGRPVRDDAWRFKLTTGKEVVWKTLEPIAHDWRSSGVKKPHQLRVLFNVKEVDK